MKKRLILAAFAALALFAGPVSMASTATDPPALISTAATDNNTQADLLAVTLPDKRLGADADARFKESQYSSVVGGNADANANFKATRVTKGTGLAGVTRLDNVLIAGHVTSGLSLGIGAGPGDYFAVQMTSASGHVVATYSIAGAGHLM